MNAITEKLEEEIKKIERQYIDEKKPFTAVDIGNELKRQGINVRQREVSPIVRQHFKSDIYSGTGYTRTLVPVKQGQEQAYLYFHIDNQPEDYVETEQDVLPWDPSKPVFQDEVEDENNAGDSNNLDSVVNTDDTDGTNNAAVKSSSLDNYVASKRSVVYHDKSCTYAGRIRQHNKVSFSDTKNAVSDGYRKCMLE